MHKKSLNRRSNPANELESNSSLSVFKQKILDSIKHSLQDQTILFMPLNDALYMLVIPPTFNYSLEETRQVAKEIQQGILPNKHNDEPYHILTWQEVINQNHFNKACKTWDVLHNNNFAANTQLVFFANVEKARKTIHDDISQLGFGVESQYGSNILIVSNGEFEEHLNLLKLTALSIWQAQEILTTTSEVIRSLTSTFRLYYSILHQLKKHFANASFWRENGQLHVMQDQIYGSINYRSIANSIRFSKTGIEEWISQSTLQDLINIDDYPVLSVRSPVFLKARPTAMCEAKKGFVLAIETLVEQRLHPVYVEEQSKEFSQYRLKHYLNEAIRHVGERQFYAHVYVHEDPKLFGAILIGDQIASISTHPGLIYGAIQSLGVIPTHVHVLSNSEDTIVIVNTKMPADIIRLLQDKAANILQTLYPDGSDVISLDCQIKIPAFACGEFNFKHIPLPYFELIDTANDPKIALPPGRADYLKGLAFELIQEWNLAAQAFKRAYSLDSADGEISYALGRALSELNQHQEALTFLERAFTLLPEDPDIANCLGVAYLECHQKENAIQVLKHAVSMQPDDVQFLFNLGRCYFANQKLKEAEKVLTKALRYAPNFPEAHATLAQVRWLLGDLSSAKKHARKAFAASPNNKYVKDLFWALSMDDDEGA